MGLLLVGLLLVICTALFAVQNHEPVTVRWLVWEQDLSLALVILGATVLGAVLYLVASLGGLWRQTREARQLAKLVESQGARIRELESQSHERHSAPTFIP
ncbi:MAG TPA: LapA family protein [Nitrospiraceae bacterium]|nr:LapA family protein [Nitrospiraceae bacterium]